MLFKLASRQGARPVLLSPTKRTGVPRPLCRSYVLDKWRQLRNTLFALARPPTPTPCSSSKRTREDENDIGRYHNSEHEIGETQAIGPPGGKENSETRTCEVRGKLVEAPAGIGGIRVVGQRSSARCHYRGSQGSSRLPPCITRGGSTQQRRPYSKDGFGGGQHFPHSDHEQVATFSMKMFQYDVLVFLHPLADHSLNGFRITLLVHTATIFFRDVLLCVVLQTAVVRPGPHAGWSKLSHKLFLL